MPTKIAVKLQTKKSPKLRFPGFSDAWEEKRLGEVVDFLKGIGIAKDDIVKNGKNRCIRYGELYTEYNEIINEVKSRTNISEKKSLLSKKNDVLLPSSGETALDIARSSCIREDGILLGGDLNVLRLRKNQDGIFFAYYLSNFQKIKIARISQGHSVVHLYASQLKNLKINLPFYQEQQKIAGFLGVVDEWIENLKKQKENFEAYKKGMMQKIFSQEIRFKDDNGKAFLKWEEKKLSEICEIKKGKQLNRIELSVSEGYPVINGGIEPSGFTDTWNTETNTITISEGGNSCGFVNFIKENFWSGGHCYALSKVKKEADLNFLYQYLKFLQKKIMRLRVGSGLPNIQKKDIDRLKLNFPELPEQQKIADFLTSIDKIIESKQQQITQAEAWKRGLMQGLFV